MKMLKPKLYSAGCIRKLEKPVLTKDDIPYDASLIFNAGVAKYKGKYIMVFRNDYGPTEKTYPAVRFRTSLGFAVSDDGINWKVSEKTIFDNKNLLPEDEITKAFCSGTYPLTDSPISRHYKAAGKGRIEILDGKNKKC